MWLGLDSILKSRDITLPTKVHIVSAMVFSSSHVWMWELDHKEAWVPMNWCFQLKKIFFFGTPKSPLYSKKNKPINPKGNQPWIFIGRTGAEAEVPILWTPDVKRRPIGKDPDAGKECGQEKGATEDEMVGWLHWFNGHEFEQVLGDSEGQGSLMCCGSWDHQELDTT